MQKFYLLKNRIFRASARLLPQVPFRYFFKGQLLTFYFKNGSRNGFTDLYLLETYDQ